MTKFDFTFPNKPCVPTKIAVFDDTGTDVFDDAELMAKRLREAKRALACILHNLSYCPWCHLEGEYNGI